MGVDPDKKIEKDKEKREGLYQSSQTPKHFENEGSEFGTTKPKAEDNNRIGQDADYDKVHGLKSDKKEDKDKDKREQ